MTRSSAATANLPARAIYPPAWSRATANARVPTAVFWLFLVFFMVSLANVGTIIQRIYKQESALNPILFGVATVLIVPWTRGVRGFAYLTVAWIFVVTYGVLGFLGPYCLMDFFDYNFAQLIIKLWIGVIGIPWLTARAVDKERLPTLLKSSVVVAVAGGLFAILQVAYPKPFIAIMSDPGRGAGFWVNPNNCGVVCGLAVFVSLLCPFRSKSINLAMRMVLVAGVVSTLSRAGLVGLAVGTVVYGVVSKRLKTVIQLAFMLVVIFIATTLALDYMATQSQNLRVRIGRVQGILRGDFSESKGARNEIWRMGFEAVQKDWLIGRGHGAMARVVPIGSGLGPHNYFLFVWGNSGFAALLAFLGLLFMLFRYGLRAEERRSKSALLAMTVMLFMFAMVDHAYIAHQFMGPLMAVVALTGHYAQKTKIPRPVLPPAMPRPVA